MEEFHERDVARLTALLTLLIRVSGRSRRSLEEELGLGSSALSKILTGTVRLQVSHVLMIVAALGVEPGEFFRWAYPFRGRSSELIENARTLASAEPEDPAPGLVSSTRESADAEFDERIRESLLRLLRR